jgi:hypothetical protein
MVEVDRADTVGHFGTVRSIALAVCLIASTALTFHSGVGAVSASSYSSTVLGDGPISYWRLGETSGTTAADSGNGGNPGAINGGVTLGVPGAVVGDANAAMSFNGSTGYVGIPDKANLDITGDITVEAWAKPNSLNGTTQTVLTKGDNNSTNTGGWQYRLSITSGNQWKALVYSGTTSYAVTDTQDVPSTSAWAYLVLIRSGTTLTFYVNGVNVGSTSAPGALNTGTGILAFGRAGSYAGYYFSGAIDEVAVYNYALSVNQIQSHYTIGSGGGVSSTATPTSTPVATATATATVTGSDPVIMTAGDIACDPTSASFNGGNGTGTTDCHEKYTGNELSNIAAVLPLGDLQYSCGTSAEFSQSYDPTWGLQKSITHPVAGNHEYGNSSSCTPGSATDYYSYFGSSAGDSSKGYYSYDVGTWHIIALNSECGNVGGCAAGSVQEQWLSADLAAHSNTCTLAYWHRPLFASGASLGDTSMHDMWVDLYNAHADLVLNGHDHDYERFAPQDPAGTADPTNGIREIIVGTGGDNLTPFNSPAANSQVRASDTFGVLKLTLHSNSYDWQFVGDGHSGTFADQGTSSCH